MKTFSKSFVAGRTCVQIDGTGSWYKVKSIHPTRKWVELEGICGNFQRGHIVCYTNKDVLPSNTL